MWPPLYHVLLGVALLAGGPPDATALGLVAIFAAWAAWRVFQLLRPSAGSTPAAAAALLFLLTPTVARLSSAVMVDIVVAALAVESAHWLMRVRAHRRPPACGCDGAFAAAACLTKGNGVAVVLMPLVVMAGGRAVRPPAPAWALHGRGDRPDRRRAAAGGELLDGCRHRRLRPGDSGIDRRADRRLRPVCAGGARNHDHGAGDRRIGGDARRARAVHHRSRGRWRCRVWWWRRSSSTCSAPRHGIRYFTVISGPLIGRLCQGPAHRQASCAARRATPGARRAGRHRLRGHGRRVRCGHFRHMPRSASAPSPTRSRATAAWRTRSARRE